MRVTPRVLTLVTIGLIAGCGPERLSSLPVQAPERQVTATPSPPAAAAPSRTAGGGPERASRPRKRPRKAGTTPSTGPPTAGPSSSCWGAIRYELDLATTELALVGPMCFQTGGVLGLRGTEPGLITAEPGDLVETSYEAGVQDVAFVRPGTVTVTIPRDEQTYTITVVVNA